MRIIVTHRLEVGQKIKDGRALSIKKKIASFGYEIKKVFQIDVYTINKDVKSDDLKKIGELLINPVIEEININKETIISDFDWAIEIGYLPGVTDNIAHTVKEEIEDFLGTKFNKNEDVYTSRLYSISGDLRKDEIDKISLLLHNPLIQRAIIKDKNQYLKNGGMGIFIPKVKLTEGKDVLKVNLDIPDDQLIKIGKQGIENKDGSRRGPLALDLASLKVIRGYFNQEKRTPTDIEIETIAQTWSEHCKHTIFAANFDDIKDGLYRGYIKKATHRVREMRGKDDICVSVFTDNSGAIIFDDDYLITDKVETHNSPSALDPFGGAITGIVGVNRDAIGFGMGAKPIANRFGYCFASPKDERPLYKGEKKQRRCFLLEK